MLAPGFEREALSNEIGKDDAVAVAFVPEENASIWGLLAVCVVIVESALLAWVKRFVVRARGTAAD